ncbi:uncharacterized protein LOC135493378 isoform X2 [Lineus longissimus]|uniref:uncharacterized protein LOC135493378 isoform X2 n=1 Tax=Lineus longissimus TaxID=88925 RepID=UPI00315C96BE
MDLFPDSKDDRGSFRLGLNRRMEIELNQELGDVMKKTMREVSAAKELKRFEPGSKEELLVHKMRPGFTPERRKLQRKTEPFFQENLETGKESPDARQIAGVPLYNALDKGPTAKPPPGGKKLKKFPFSKNKPITVEEMRRPRVTSIGVTPTRGSSSIEGLKVVMEGKPADENIDYTLSEMEKANTAPPLSPLQEVTIDTRPDGFATPARSMGKPAILGEAGTVGQVTYTERQKSRPISSRTSSQKRPKSSGPHRSGLREADLEKLDRDQEMDADQKSVSTTSTVKSVKELVEEAKALSRPESEKMFTTHAKVQQKPKRKKDASPGQRKDMRSEKSSPRKSKTPKGTEKDASSPAKTETALPPTRESGRSVDEIIASLKVQSREGSMSEADRRIQEIMDRVISRTSAVLGDDGAPSTTSDEVPDEPTVEEEDVEEEEKPASPESDITGPIIDAAEEALAALAKQQEEAARAEQEERDRLEQERLDQERAEKEKEEACSQAQEDLQLPLEVNYEDLVSITGQKTALKERSPEKLMVEKGPKPHVESESVSFLSSWAPKEYATVTPPEPIKPDVTKNMHHFCTVTSDFQLPKPFQGVVRKYQTAAKYEIAHEEGKLVSMPSTPYSMFRQDNTEVRERRLSAAAKRILDEATAVGFSDDTVEQWKERADAVFEESDIVVEGKKMALLSDESRLYWHPAPPMMDIPPAKVKEHLFPQYRGNVIAAHDFGETLDESEESDIEEEEASVQQEDPEEFLARERLLNRRHGSCEDLTFLKRALAHVVEESDDGLKTGSITTLMTASDFSLTEKSDKGTKRGDLSSIDEGSEASGPVVTLSFAEMRKKFAEAAVIADQPEEETPYLGMSDEEIFPTFDLRRTNSAPCLALDDDFLVIPKNFNTALEELERQQVKVKESRSNVGGTGSKPVVSEVKLEEEVDDEDLEGLEKLPSVASVAKASSQSTSPFHKIKLRADIPTPAELALEAGRAYVMLPKKKKKQKFVDMSRIDEIERFLNQDARKLTRSSSMIDMKKPVERSLRVPPQLRGINKWGSNPDLLDFEAFSKKRHLSEQQADDPVGCVRDIWNAWFDERYPEPKEESESSYNGDAGQTYQEGVESDSDEEEGGHKKYVIPDSNLELPETIEPVLEVDEGDDAVELIEEEIEILTNIITSTNKANAFDLCRRGALYRKIGKLCLALSDLNRAIEMEPMLLDAYWHRHLLYLLQDKRKSALEDLNFLLKHNKSHAGAYRSRAEIYKKSNDLTMAIINYSQAIKIYPDDHDAYLKRAQMYEQRGEMLLALEDYQMTTKLNPTMTDGLLKHGLYYFKNESWQPAINDFTELLKQNPGNAEAHTYRGRCYTKLSMWNAAVEDLSAAIHLDPDNSIAFYYRGCILRKAHPKQALQDFSVSLLIDDSEDNILAYLHRGILYNEMGRPEDAIPDFESVLKLNKDNACAHNNLGLIYYQMENYHTAIKRFSSAIKVDPTYIRAYVCRGEAYFKIHELKSALLDFTRAIHLKPDVVHYYMYRGFLLLKMGNLDLAGFCVRHAAELGSTQANALSQNATQQAMVQAFLKNYDKAIEAFTMATKQKPKAPLFILLGKMQMKAKAFKDAVESFEKALELLKPWGNSIRPQWPKEGAQVHHLIGMCYSELRNYLSAHDAFNSSLKINPKYADSYYQRGLVKMKLKQSKGIQDFNKALAIDPKIFQAYLSRAAYYGMRGNYSKAILNCNEAIKLQPNSVRAYLYRGSLKYHIKAYELAIKDLSAAANIDNTCALAYFNRAVCYHDMKEYTKALMDYGIVLLLGDYLKLKVLINRGLLYLESGDYNNALYDFLAASSVNPRDIKLHHTLGLCYHKLNMLEEAVRSFTKALELDHFFLDAYIGRGNVFMDFGTDMGRMFAGYDYQRCLVLQPTYLSARVNLAYNLQMHGKFMQAWHQFTIAIEQDPRFKPALEGRAIINLQMGNVTGAYQDICSALRIEPTAELYTNRGVINQFMGDHINAMQDYKRAVASDPKYGLAYYNVANLYFKLRQFQQAKAYYDKASLLNKMDESAYLNRAITRVLLHDTKGALDDFEKAAKLSPNSAHIYFNRGNLYSSLKEWQKAEKDYTKALSLQPDDPAVHKRRADIRGKLGRKDAAIRDYKKAIEIQSTIGIRKKAGLPLSGDKHTQPVAVR